MSDLNWMRMGGDEWYFGKMVRGIIREPLALVFCQENGDRDWCWLVPKTAEKGRCFTIVDAVKEAEESLSKLGHQFNDFLIDEV